MNVRHLFLGTVLLITIASFLAYRKKKGAPDPVSTNGSTNTMIHTSGTNIVDAGGNVVRLRGVCFGNEVWGNNPLPYTHHSEDDFARVHDMGMNVIRFYLNYLTFEDETQPYRYKTSGWDWLDLNIEWAKKHNVYLILNMHVPQGGFQSTGNGNALWTNPENQKRLKALWCRIAKRYANEPVIIGFDLLNEPVVTKSKYQWQNLAQQLVDTIRTVDKNHMLIVERLNAVGNNWSSDQDMNFFLVNDPNKNTAYTFHFYTPMEYTHQNTSWTNLGDGGKYPDETIVTAGGPTTWFTATFSNPTLPVTSTSWTFLQGVKFKIEDTAIKLGKPALIGASTGSRGKVYFDDIVIREYDATQNYVRDVMTLNPVSADHWYYWSADKSGKAGFSTDGHGDNGSLVISGTGADVNYSQYRRIFVPKQGYYYEISGWAKGENLASTAACKLRIDFETSQSPVYSRNKHYLASELDKYAAWGAKNNVALYCGEFGLYKDCFENGKGGTAWVGDMLELFKQKKIAYTYHAYHEDNFGIYPGYGTLPNPSEGRRELINLFTSTLK